MTEEDVVAERVRLRIQEGIAEVSLVRPDKLNALDAAMFEALGQVIDRLASHSSVRAVILYGEGRSFSAGIDLESLGSLLSDGVLPPHLSHLAERTHGDCNLFQHVALGWRRLKVPVIAALHGAVFGGGLQIALGADIRLVQADAKLSVMEIRWGLVPDMAGCLLLPQLVRDDVARDLVYSGRIVQGEEAVRLGLATRVSVDPLTEARDMAQQMAARLPAALQAAKGLLNLAHEVPAQPLLLAEAEAQQALLGSPAQLALLRQGVRQR